jgi:glycosyltransferase involved in cell wall biosynthesis
MIKSKSSLSVSLVHHWMEFFRGGEAVLEQFGELFPEAPISIMVYNRKNLSPGLQSHVFRPSFLQRLPWLRRHFRKLLPLFPAIIRNMRVPDPARFVLSSDASMIKGITIPEEAVHVCYCHSPPRYIWGLEEAYLQSVSPDGRIVRKLFSATVPHLRAFDRRMAQKVHRFIANSQCVQERILRCYGRESVVIHPPVNIDGFDPTRPREDFFLVVSALVPYKRVDLAVDACSRLGRRLVVIGTGPEEANLKRSASPHVTFLGWQSGAVVRDHFERCQALLFPGIEDFGITPCEAQAAGAPVIAFAAGGALETVRDGITGLFFEAQTVDSLMATLQRFEEMRRFSSETCRANVEHLGPARFRRNVREFLEQEYPELFAGHVWPEEAAPHDGRVPFEVLPAGALSLASADMTRAGSESSRKADALGRVQTALEAGRNWLKSVSTNWRLLIALLAAAGGVIVGTYLTLRTSSDFDDLTWIPHPIIKWCGEYGRFRNFPAYALLALPFLALFRERVSRGRMIAALAVLAAALEFGQLFIQTRWFEWEDIAWSWAGLLASWSIVEVIQACKQAAVAASAAPTAERDGKTRPRFPRPIFSLKGLLEGKSRDNRRRPKHAGP